MGYLEIKRIIDEKKYKKTSTIEQKGQELINICSNLPKIW